MAIAGCYHKLVVCLRLEAICSEIEIIPNNGHHVDPPLSYLVPRPRWWRLGVRLGTLHSNSVSAPFKRWEF